MADEEETVLDEPQTDEPTPGEETDDAPAPEAPPEPVETTAPTPVSPPPPPPPPAAIEVDLDAELNAVDALNDKLEKGEILPDEYNKQYAKHQRVITKAQRALVEPAKQVQQTLAQQNQARQYWTQWGKGTDVAQLEFAKTVPAARAQALFKEAMDELAAHPRYANRPEMDLSSVGYSRWMDKLEAEAKKKPTVPAPRTPAAPGTRVSGASATNNPPVSDQRTARQRLEDGEYDIAGDAKRRGMI